MKTYLITISDNGKGFSKNYAMKKKQHGIVRNIGESETAWGKSGN